MWLKILLFPFKLLSWAYRLLIKFWRLYVFLNVLAIFLLIFAIWGFNLWFPKAAEVYVKQKTHFPLSIANSECSLLHGTFDWKGVDLRNPKGNFKQEYCVQLNQLAVDVNWLSLLQAKLDLGKVVLDIDKVVCEKGADGEYNVTTLYKSFRDKQADTKISDIPPSKEASRRNLAKRGGKVMTSNGTENVKIPESASNPTEAVVINNSDSCFIVRQLEIRLGSCELYNITHNGEEKININKTWVFYDVTSKDQIINTLIRDLQGLGVSIVIKNVIGSIFDLPVLSTVADSVEKVHDASKEMVKGVASSLKELLPTKESINNSLEQLKKGFGELNSEDLDSDRISNILRSRRK